MNEDKIGVLIKGSVFRYICLRGMQDLKNLVQEIRAEVTEKKNAK